jgi:hypothetical protein
MTFQQRQSGNPAGRAAGSHFANGGGEPRGLCAPYCHCLQIVADSHARRTQSGGRMSLNEPAAAQRKRGRL